MRVALEKVNTNSHQKLQFCDIQISWDLMRCAWKHLNKTESYPDLTHLTINFLHLRAQTEMRKTIKHDPTNKQNTRRKEKEYHSYSWWWVSCQRVLDLWLLFVLHISSRINKKKLFNSRYPNQVTRSTHRSGLILHINSINLLISYCVHSSAPLTKGQLICLPHLN